MPVVYSDLRRLAAYYLNGSDGERTLQPTALVHDAYLRFGAARKYDWQGHGQLIAVVSRFMRNILIDNARARRAAKRNPAELEASEAIGEDLLDLLSLDAALRQLESLHPRRARVVELRFFGDRDLAEVAAVLEVSLSSVERDWRFARAWLHDPMNPTP